MPQVSQTDKQLIEQLHTLVFNDPESNAALDSAFNSALAIFEQPDYSLPYASYNLPITLFEDKLADEQKGMVGLCRVFILRAGCKMPRPEIHRNSIQRLVSYKGEGAICSASPGGVDMTFKACAIASPTAEQPSTIETSWDVVPSNTWHYPLAGTEEDWFTVTFHSATEDEIIDEYAETST